MKCYSDIINKVMNINPLEKLGLYTIYFFFAVKNSNMHKLLIAKIIFGY
jgi:hypothetical protein